MATASAAQRYWAAMAQLRSSEPVSPAAGSKLQTCSVDLGGSDAMYMSRCLAAWREITSAPSAQSAQQVFARDYYRWTQRYLREALQRRADATSEPAGRVIWALDVWARVQYALFALNVAWGEVFRFDSTGQPPFRPRVLEKLEAARTQETRWAESSRKAMVEKYQLSSSADTRRAAASAQLQPIPFGELAVQWVGESRAQYSRKANPLWSLLLDAVRPWSSDWHEHWITSKGGKDAAELQLAASDPLMQVALMQWRLWSVQDFASDKGATAVLRAAINAAWPLHMGRRFSCSTLFAYITAAATESAHVEVVYEVADGVGRAYPNLAHGVSLLAAYASTIIDLDFDQEVTDYLGRYLRRFRPPFRDDGSQMTRGELAAIGGGAGFNALPPTTAAERNKLAPIPITYADYREYLRGIAVIQPAACRAGDKTCQLSVTAQQKLRKTPMWGLQQQINKAALVAFDVLGIGGAVGGGLAPVYGLPNPFARSFGDEAFKTAIVGKTVTALERLPRAIANLEGLLPGLFSTGATTQVIPPAKQCTTYFYGPNDTPCEVCEGQWPPCAEHVPGLKRPAAQVDAVLLCQQQWVAWLNGHPAAASCFSISGHPLFWQLCGQVLSGQKTPDGAFAEWMVYAQKVCPALRPRGGLLELFGRKVVHAGTFGFL